MNQIVKKYSNIFNNNFKVALSWILIIIFGSFVIETVNFIVLYFLGKEGPLIIYSKDIYWIIITLLMTFHITFIIFFFPNLNKRVEELNNTYLKINEYITTKNQINELYYFSIISFIISILFFSVYLFGKVGFDIMVLFLISSPIISIIDVNILDKTLNFYKRLDNLQKLGLITIICISIIVIIFLLIFISYFFYFLIFKINFYNLLSANYKINLDSSFFYFLSTTIVVIFIKMDRIKTSFSILKNETELLEFLNSDYKSFNANHIKDYFSNELKKNKNKIAKYYQSVVEFNENHDENDKIKRIDFYKELVNRFNFQITDEINFQIKIIEKTENITLLNCLINLYGIIDSIIKNQPNHLFEYINFIIINLKDNKLNLSKKWFDFYFNNSLIDLYSYRINLLNFLEILFQNSDDFSYSNFYNFLDYIIIKISFYYDNRKSLDFEIKDKDINEIILFIYNKNQKKEINKIDLFSYFQFRLRYIKEDKEKWEFFDKIFEISYKSKDIEMFYKLLQYKKINDNKYLIKPKLIIHSIISYLENIRDIDYCETLLFDLFINDIFPNFINSKDTPLHLWSSSISDIEKYKFNILYDIYHLKKHDQKTEFYLLFFIFIKRFEIPEEKINNYLNLKIIDDKTTFFQDLNNNFYQDEGLNNLLSKLDEEKIRNLCFCDKEIFISYIKKFIFLPII